LLTPISIEDSRASFGGEESLLRALRIIQALLSDRRAATAVEYGMILALVFLALVYGVVALGNATSGVWNNVSAQVANAT